MQRLILVRVIPVMLCCVPFVSATAQTKEANSADQTMTITSLEYRERSGAKPYLLEGKTSGPPSLIYKLICGRGAAALKVGHRYNVSEGADEDGVKVLLIRQTAKESPAPPAGLPPGATYAGIECAILSAKLGKR